MPAQPLNRICYVEDDEDIQRIVQLAEEQGIRTRCLADIFETHRAPVPEGDGESESSTIAITGIQKEWQYVVKRTADILVASLLLIAASPVMLASALAIKATSDSQKNWLGI